MNKQDGKSKKSTVGVVVGILIALAGLLSPFVGCGVGTSFGYQQEYGNTAPAGNAVLYDHRYPSNPVPIFWVVQYPVGDDAYPQPRLIELTDPDIEDGEWFFGPPSAHNRLTIGPWEQPPQWDQQGDLEWGKPLGKLEVLSGGAQFETASDQSIRVELILYPVDKGDGWVRWYYTYEIRNNAVIPLQLKREYQTSDWALDTVVYLGFIGAVVGTIVGVGLLIAGVLICVFSP